MSVRLVDVAAIVAVCTLAIPTACELPERARTRGQLAAQCDGANQNAPGYPPHCAAIAENECHRLAGHMAERARVVIVADEVPLDVHGFECISHTEDPAAACPAGMRDWLVQGTRYCTFGVRWKDVK